MNKRGLVLIVVVIIILAAVFYLVFHTKTCKTSGCFETAALNCKKAAIEVKEANGSISQYTIQGKESGNCDLHIKMLKIGSLSEELQKKFEGKEMTCNIPLNEFSRMKIEDMGANLDYCHGPLKEEIYDIVIKKLYNLVIRDMSSVLQEVERVL